MLIVESLVLYVLLMLLAWGLGIRLSRQLNIVYGSRIECFAFAVGLGLASLIGVGFALGIVGWLTTGGICVSLAVLAVIGFPALRGARQLVVPAAPAEGQPTSRLISFVAWLFMGALLIVNLLGALAPDTIWDANSYHLNVAQQWLLSGRLVYLPDNFYGSWPLNLSVLYAIEMGLSGGSPLPQLTHFGLGVLSALLIYVYVRPRYGLLTATLATLIFYSVPVITWLSGTAISDLGVAYFTLFAVSSWLRWIERRAQPWLIMAALGTGLTMGTKLTGLFTLAILAIAILYVGWLQRRAAREIILNVALACVAALALALPWYLKSYLQTGNPVFPFGFSLFGGQYWTSSVDRQFSVMQFSFQGIGRSLLDFVLLPLRLLVPAHVPYEGPISAIFLLGAAWGTVQRRNRSVHYLVVFAGLNFVLWALWTTQPVRMLLPALGALSIVAGIGLGDVAQRYRWGPVLVSLIAGLLMIEGALSVWRERSSILSDQLSVVLGRESREAYLRKYLEPADILFFANEHLPANSAILAFDEVRSFLSQHRVVWAMPNLQAYVDYEQLKTSEALRQRLREIGTDYVLIRQTFIPRQLKPIENDLQLVYESNDYRLYHLTENDPLASRDCYELPNSSRVCPVNTKAEVAAGEIVKDSHFTQTFMSECAGRIGEIELYLATYARNNTSILGLSLTDLETQQRLVNQLVPAAEIADNQWRKFTFDPLVTSIGKHYRITLLSPDAKPGNAVSVWRSAADGYAAGEAAINQQPIDGDWAFRYSCTQRTVKP